MDWKLTCRVCLETGDMVSLFDWDENDKQLSDKYAYCCGIQVTKDDLLPTLICFKCVDRLMFAYEFKVQCISSNDILKECLEDFMKSTIDVSNAKASEVTETETITVKQENGQLLQYTLTKTPSTSVVTKAPGPNKRGRPRKYPNRPGYRDVAPYCRSKTKAQIEELETDTELLKSRSQEEKTKPADETIVHEDLDGVDSDCKLTGDEVDSENEGLQESQSKKRNSKVQQPKKQKQKHEDDKHVLVSKETSTEPASDNELDTMPKSKKNPIKKTYEKTYTCETCKGSFSSNSALQIHIRRHLGIKPFKCAICEFACVMKLELQRHMWTHTGHRPYKCSMCDRRFGDYGSRQKHERVHTGQRPYKCTICGRAFNYSYVLTNHMATHTGEKKHSCGQCNKKFIKLIQLQSHNKRYHKELYQQQKLQSDFKRSRQKVDLSGIFEAISELTDEDGEQEQDEEDHEVTVKVERNYTTAGSEG